ncbi:MAG: VCBS repeat-containing protein, partial [Gemmatimonadota bacterium]|nr:VCBS repeat-containing protein [Gemmatimonadota bacterium]
GVTFAMGGRDSATLRVRWPSGARTTRRVATNTAVELFEPEPGAAPPSFGGDGAERAAAGSGSAAGPLFSPWPAAARHAESDFDELVRQPLIPLELSRLGPGVTWADVDEDGTPELLVAGAAGGRAQRLESGADGVLAPVPFGPRAPGDQTTLLALRMGDGMEIVAGVSSWEARSPDDLTRIPPAVGLAGGGEIAAQATPDATGPLSAADVDGDGALDLFLGARAIPGAYPRAASSRILLRRDGIWREDPGWSAAFRSVGLVSASVFSDVDLDGDPDLLLALEWGPVRLFLNRGTGFEDATAAWGLAGLPGRWNGLATGDLDGDGRPDLVATGWGDNVSYPPSADRPTGILAADMDGNGLVDVIEFETRPNGDAWPTRDYPTLSAALPFIRRAAPTYERFARSSLEDLFGSDPPRASRVSAVTYAHTAFLNRAGRFEARPLPSEAQRAPAFGVVIGDFDRDGAEDVFLAQNFLATPQGLPRFDAGRGLLLAGDGEGGLVPLGARESGIAVYGDGRGAAAADADGDGRWDLAIGQNGGEVAVFRGSSGPPGLRVRLRDAGANPDAIGARLRVRYEEGVGPAREIQAGAGYGSSGGLAQVFGLRGRPVGVRVWWPGGVAEDFPIDADERSPVLVRGTGERP